MDSGGNGRNAVGIARRDHVLGGTAYLELLWACDKLDDTGESLWGYELNQK